MSDLSNSNLPDDVIQFVSGTKQWFYQPAAPTGWTIDMTLGNAVLAVHGSSSYAGSSGGGEQQGTWTQPDHNHQWYEFIGAANTRYFDAAGAPVLIPGSAIAEPGILTNISGGDGWILQFDAYTTNDAPLNTWRPFANVGIVATKD